MIDIAVTYGSTPVRFSYAWVCRILKYVLNKERVRHKVLGVRFVDDTEMIRHNRTCRKKHGPTDVLSFGYEDESGDIIVDVDYVRRIVHVQRGRMSDQAGMLLVHGLLHILGYDHEHRAEARRMWKKQDAYAAYLGVDRIAFDDFG